MVGDYISISYLNDFIFCPRSIYFHNLYGNFNTMLYQQTAQIKGQNAHGKISSGKYSSRQDIWQDTFVYSAKYQLCGKIDVFDVQNQHLIERKITIKTLYDGYIFQVYAQYFCLQEMGNTITKITLHDYTHNKNYPVKLPHQDQDKLRQFEELIARIKNYRFETVTANAEKCKKCIYSQLCDQPLC